MLFVCSNKEGKIGFLNRENWVCVVLLRVKMGLYVIGNFDNIWKFLRKCRLWGKVIKIVDEMGVFGRGFLFFCVIYFFCI